MSSSRCYFGLRRWKISCPLYVYTLYTRRGIRQEESFSSVSLMVEKLGRNNSLHLHLRLIIPRESPGHYAMGSLGYIYARIAYGNRCRCMACTDWEKRAHSRRIRMRATARLRIPPVTTLRMIIVQARIVVSSRTSSIVLCRDLRNTYFKKPKRKCRKIRDIVDRHLFLHLNHYADTHCQLFYMNELIVSFH